MSQIVKLRRSSTGGNRPTNSQLQLGELAINTTDGKLYFAKSGSASTSIEEIVTTNAQNTGSLNLSGSFNLIGAENITGSLNTTGSLRVLGNTSLTSLEGAFYNATSLISVPSLLPLTVSNLSKMFSGASSFNQDISTWNTAGITNMSYMFQNATLFNNKITNQNTNIIGSIFLTKTYIDYLTITNNGDFGFATEVKKPTNTLLTTIIKPNQVKKINKNDSDEEVSDVSESSDDEEEIKKPMKNLLVLNKRR
jgi:surface protein